MALAAAWSVAQPGIVRGADSVSAERAQAVPTQRDPHGRLRAPVFINGRGPFNLIVDTGANGSAVSASVVDALGLTSNEPVILHGVTGSSKVQAVAVDSIRLGDRLLPAQALPVVHDALEGADGFLGTGAFVDKRVLIDFARGRIAVFEPGAGDIGRGYVRVPADLSRARLVTVDTRVNGAMVKAIIDTGAAATVGNRAMRRLLAKGATGRGEDRILGTTAAVDLGETLAMPPIALGSLYIAGARASFADVSIFGHVRLNEQPALLIGMDVLGQFDSMVIDYAAHELALKPIARIPRAG